QINSLAMSMVYLNEATTGAAKAITIEIKKKEEDEIGGIEK
ncbi:20255_t:CDS:1, partial [Funneliformis geosporum]